MPAVSVTTRLYAMTFSWLAGNMTARKESYGAGDASAPGAASFSPAAPAWRAASRRISWHTRTAEAARWWPSAM